jgi:hypothetical protein
VAALPEGSGAAYRPPRLSTSGRQTLIVAVTAYGIVALFGAAYGVIALLWPKLPTSTAAVIAALVAAPAALALIWPRLTAVKAFGVEISLEQATARELEPGLVNAVMAGTSSNAEVLESLKVELTEPVPVASIVESPSPLQPLEQMRKTASGKLVPIDLGGGDQWLSTRLYLIAALADDFMRVPQFVFTARYPHDKFVGMASPSAVRMALGLALPPTVDEAYVKARREAIDLAPDRRLTHIATQLFHVVHNIEWPGGFGGPLDAPSASRSRTRYLVTRNPDVPWVTGDKLYAWLTAAGKTLDTKAIVATGLSHEQLVRAVALDTRDRHVALVAATGELEAIVDRLAILAQAADPNRRSRLWASSRSSQ